MPKKQPLTMKKLAEDIEVLFMNDVKLSGRLDDVPDIRRCYVSKNDHSKVFASHNHEAYNDHEEITMHMLAQDYVNRRNRNVIIVSTFKAIAVTIILALIACGIAFIIKGGC